MQQKEKKEKTNDMAALIETKIAVAETTTDVYETGSYSVTNITVKTTDSSRPPVESFIVTPTEKGNYPVLLFCHGFVLSNTWYTDLLSHVASHGYIVIAPQFWNISIPKEIRGAAQVTEWICSTTGLATVLPQMVNPDKENLALSGHSRGGKLAFALALGRDTNKKNTKRKTSPLIAPLPKFKALIGICPVAGAAPSSVPDPKILEYIPRCFDMSIPVAVIGSGYDNKSVGFIPPFGADGVNHAEFFNESKPPACYFLAKDYGHIDMLDDWIAYWLGFIAKSGKGPRDLMRKGVGGNSVAFLRAYLGACDDKDLNAIVNDPSIAPIVLDPVIYVEE